MKKQLIQFTLATALTVSMTASTLAQSAGGALEVVKNSVGVVLADLKQNKSLYQQDPLTLNQMIETKMLPYFDTTRMAAKALGIEVVKSSTKQQLRDFINEFKILSMRSYSTELLNYADATVTYGTPEVRSETYTQVDATVTNTDGKVYPISLTVRFSKGQWKIVDISAEGISFITSFGSQLQPKLETIGLQGIIDEYKALNANGSVLQK